MKQISCAAVVVRGDELLLQYNLKKGGNEFPGGKHEGDETMQECAARELLQETGIDIHPTDLHFFGYVDEEAGWLAMMFLGFVPDGTEPELREPDKHSGYHWLPVHQLHALEQPTESVRHVIHLFNDVIADMVENWPRFTE